MPPPPPPSPKMLWCFEFFLKRYLPRNFHTISVLDERPVDVAPDEPLLIALNHPSWWDPLVALQLGRSLFPDRTHHTPIDAAALEKYRLFRKLGAFGVEQDSVAGARQFLRDSAAILNRPGTALWITAQGTFADPRAPLSLQPGMGHLLASLDRGTVLTLAIEYPFWEERLPEALAAFGDPIRVSDRPDATKHHWTELVRQSLAATQAKLAAASIGRQSERFIPLLRGRADVGGFYDLGRRLKSWVSLRRFRPEHGQKLNDAERFGA